VYPQNLRGTALLQSFALGLHRCREAAVSEGLVFHITFLRHDLRLFSFAASNGQMQFKSMEESWHRKG
jgi:hypothetical protein